MKSCWDESWESRPIFSRLHEHLSSLCQEYFDRREEYATYETVICNVEAVDPDTNMSSSPKPTENIKRETRSQRIRARRKGIKRNS